MVGFPPLAPPRGAAPARHLRPPYRLSAQCAQEIPERARRALRVRVSLEVDRLEEPRRTVLALYHLGWSAEEIARALGCEIEQVDGQVRSEAA
jgi:DNA-directed RNA polymerase specialized sigma24 family protein